jgi:hypothetical protein
MRVHSTQSTHQLEQITKSLKETVTTEAPGKESEFNFPVGLKRNFTGDHVGYNY